jgi:ankyrin repeat protein
VSIDPNLEDDPFLAPLVTNDVDLLRARAATFTTPEALRTAVTGALLRAAMFSRLEIIQALIDLGADVNVLDELDGTPLIDAVDNEDPRVMETLLRSGADPNVASGTGLTALMSAAMDGNRRAVLVLLEHGADINAADLVGRTALMRAAREGHQELCELLLQAGADPTLRDWKERTAHDLLRARFASND